MVNPERVVELSERISTATANKVGEVNKITASVRILALNALIEAQRAGDQGRGFAVVANEVKTISEAIAGVAGELESQLKGASGELAQIGRQLVDEVRGTRLTDLAYNMIEIIDRNLYERSCDVRWWATDAAVVEACADPDPGKLAYASKRLEVILNAYTVYLDLWIADRHGRVIATGRPLRYPRATGTNVAQETWFREALASGSGDDYAVADIAANLQLDGRRVATYAAAIREGGEARGRPLGVLGIFFDWESQAQTVVDGVRLSPEEKSRTRALLLDRDLKVIAASDHQGIDSERVALDLKGRTMGYARDGNGRSIGFALTPGYETYRGLGWYGVLIQSG